MHKDIIHGDYFEYEIGLKVFEYDLQAVWVIFIEGQPAAISDFVDHGDSWDQAVSIIENMERSLHNADNLDQDVDVKDALEAQWSKFKNAYPDFQEVTQCIS